ncbi:MAG: hypothetical protein ABFS28_16100 [Bacteroidota bacterium]
MRHKVLVFMSKHMIACDEAGFLISYKQDKRLGLKKWVQLKIHLLTCHLCRKYAIQIKQLEHQLAEYRISSIQEPCHHHLSEETRTKIQQAVKKEMDVK